MFWELSGSRLLIGVSDASTRGTAATSRRYGVGVRSGRCAIALQRGPASAASRRWAFRPPGVMHAMERICKVILQGGERLIEGGGPSDEHVVISAARVRFGEDQDHRLEPPPDPVAANGAAELLGYREPEPRRTCRAAGGGAFNVTIATGGRGSRHGSRLAFKGEAGTRGSRSAAYAQKLRARLEGCEWQRLPAFRLPLADPKNVRR